MAAAQTFVHRMVQRSSFFTTCVSKRISRYINSIVLPVLEKENTDIQIRHLSSSNHLSKTSSRLLLDTFKKMKFFTSTIFTAVMGALAASAATDSVSTTQFNIHLPSPNRRRRVLSMLTLTPSTQSNISITDIHFSLKDLVQPFDVVHLAHDGVLRVFNTLNLTAHHAIPLSPSQVVEYLADDSSDIAAQFAGANGYNVPESQRLNPADEIVEQLRTSLENTKKEMENPTAVGSDEGKLAGRPTLPCRSYLCRYTATCVANCCLYCAVRGQSLGNCIAPFC